MKATCKSPALMAQEESIIQQAQSILAERCVLPVETMKPFKLESFTNKAAVKAIKQYLALNMSGFDTEHFHVMYFEPQGKLIKMVETGLGSERSVDANPREVLRQGLLCNASFAVVAHNHPNGDKTPSDADRKCTQGMADLLDLVGIQLVMAFVIAGPTVADISLIEPDSHLDILNDLSEMLQLKLH